jgi:hypothetical protein
MNASIAVKRLAEPWRAIICLAVVAFLTLGVATHSFRLYHLFTLLAIPGAILAAENGRRFFLDWAPLAATWIAYDRFRLVQPFLLARVGVEAPYAVERALFGWLASGQAPAHAAHAWFVAHAGSPIAGPLLAAAQGVYLAHLFLYPALLLVWWLRGRERIRDRARFVAHVRAFTALNLLGFVGYLLLPAAPPWWVTLHGLEQPTASLVATTNLATAMDGELIRRMIATAPNWFAALPSLHGGYPLVLFLLARRERARSWVLAAIAAWGAAMWAATVLLNQHYVVDLVAGAGVAAVAVWLTRESIHRDEQDRSGSSS